LVELFRIKTKAIKASTMTAIKIYRFFFMNTTI
jgi:hypothetical protein